MKFNKGTTVSLVATLALALSIPMMTSATASKHKNWAKMTSASEGGGMGKLIAACKKEGQLNVIALPHEWANYGLMLASFKATYGVKIDEANPSAGSEDEINAANINKGTKRSPDVFDIGFATAGKYKGTGIFAPYKVKLWQYMDDAESGGGEYTPNYSGTLTIGYAGKFGTVTKLDDLFDPKFKGAVALNGDPLLSSAALNGVFMINKALGGTFDDVSKGVAWFKKLKDLGNFVNVRPSEATYASGQTSVVIDNLYLQLGVQKKFAAAGVSWKVYTPAAIGSTYTSAISAWAPNPACARLWLEYSLGEVGANFWATGGATPTVFKHLLKTGRASAAAKATIGTSRIKAEAATSAQGAAARLYLKVAWPAAVGA